MDAIGNEEIPRPEYPRPQFVRENNWINLNGEWDFAFDDSNIGLKKRWYKKDALDQFDKKILVPFCFQSKLSGIDDNAFHEILWYRKEFKILREYQNKKTLIHFGAIDYECIVYLNEQYVGSHRGGYIGFTLDITDFSETNNVLVIRVVDPSKDLEILRGKQYWNHDIKGIFYPQASGIWQTVWLEFISLDYYLENLKISPNIDKYEVIFEVLIHGIGFSDLYLFTEVLFNNQSISKEEINLNFLGKPRKRKGKKTIKEKIGIFGFENPNRFKFKISIPENYFYLWDTENPNLYDLSISIYNHKTGQIYDHVKSYFGMRKISISESNPLSDKSLNRQLFLNNKPLYQKLFLIQGYWPDGLYTAPSDDSIKKDIQFVKDFGFNGLRTHQKVFDPRFLYWCDKMGVLVWGEIGNSFRFSPKSQLNLINEFVSEIERDYNHPSIIAWVPLNEGWGISGAEKDPKRGFYIISLYYLIKSIDSSRLIIDNDGWWHTENIDVCTRHFYDKTELLPKTLEDEINSHERSAPKIYLNSFKYQNEPIIYSEIGGYGYDFYKNMEKKWGYGGLIENDVDLFNSVLNLLKEFNKRKSWIQGFCYTQLYDQFQEINGLLTFDRTPKFSPKKLKNEVDKMFSI
ncbi:MAG: glycoside hydrolase family 2 protein [Candidatus Hodarchaeota archaeon]